MVLFPLWDACRLWGLAEMQGPLPALPAPTATGSLAKTPFPHLLVYALERRLSGTFELTLGETSVATMLVLGGCPAKVRTNDPIHYLGVVLSELGMITDEQLKSSLEQVKPGRLQGDILLEMGAVDAAQLEAALRSQVERKVEHLFGLSSETTFAYFDGVDLLQGVGGPPTPIDPFPVMWRGVRNTPPWEHVDGTLQKISAAMIRPSAIAQFERFAFGPQELQAVDRIKQRPARPGEVASILGPGIGQVLVYLLVIMKQLELVEAPAPPPPAPSSSQSSVMRGPSSAAVPPSGQAFARVQLQRQTARPLIVEEQVAPSGAYDERASSPGMQAPVGKQGAFGSPAPDPPLTPVITGAPAPAPAVEAASNQTGSDIGSMITNTIRSSIPPPMDAAAEAAPAVAIATPASNPPPAPAATELSPEQNALKQKILERALEINSQDYFQMLGVARDASPETIQKAFIGLAKVWHPDRLPAALVDVKEACSKVFTHLTEANATLSDPVKRQDYMTLLKDGGATPDDQAKIQAILEAATEFQKADILLKRNPNDPQAYELVKKCVALDEQPDYLATLAWLDAQKPEWQAKDKTLEKVLILDRCIQQNPNSERAIFYRAMLYKRADVPAKALKDFKRAAEINPRNLDAAREVRLYNMRDGGKKPGQGATAGERSSKAPAADKGGFFGKLFKK